MIVSSPEESIAYWWENEWLADIICNFFALLHYSPFLTIFLNDNEDH